MCPSGAARGATAETPATAGNSLGPPQREIARIEAQYPSVITGPFGRSSTAAYDAISRPRLSDAPYGIGRWRITQWYSYGGPADPGGLVAASRVAVQGRVAFIGRPHFNAEDGSFWDPALHDEPGVTDVAAEVFRDVVLLVEEMWGIAPDAGDVGPVLGFLVQGGQVEVTITDRVARKLEWGKAGIHLISRPPEIDLAVGEEVLLLLDRAPVSGLYGGRYAFRFEWQPDHPLYFKYVLRDGMALNWQSLNRSMAAGLSREAATRRAAREDPFTVPAEELRALILSRLGADAGPVPREGTFPELPHPPVPEQRGDHPPTTGERGLPEEFPRSFPFPDGARSCGWNVYHDEGRHSFETCSRVALSYEDVVRFYEETLRATGWTMESFPHGAEGRRIAAFRIQGHGFTGRLEVVEEDTRRTTLYVDLRG